MGTYLSSLQPSSPAASHPAGLGAYSPWGFGCGLRAFCSTLDAERLLQENSPNSCHMSFFHCLFETFLLLKPAAPYKEGPVLSLTQPPLQLDQGLSRSGPVAAQLSTLRCLCGCSQTLGVCLFVLIPLPVTSSNKHSLGAAQTLFGRGGSP